MTDAPENERYPYRHHGPSVHGSKLIDYLVSEANMIEDGLLPIPKEPWPFEKDKETIKRKNPPTTQG